MAVKVRRGTREFGSNESKLSKDPGTPAKSYQTQREFNSAMAVVLGTGFRTELLQYWIISENTDFENKERTSEFQLFRLRGGRAQIDLNANG